MRRFFRFLGAFIGVAALIAVAAAVGVFIGARIVESQEPETAVAARPSSAASVVAPEPSIRPLITNRPSGGTVGGQPSSMPITGDCLACHQSADGGVATKEIPALAHPLEGWTQCTACHAPNRLVKTAPGHTGIHADGCLLCHTKVSPAPPMRPHTLELTADCLSCHGKSEPLPHSMADRTVSNCWLCHQSSPDQAPTSPHRVQAGDDCRGCHDATKIGALPRSHAGWADRTCITCHQSAKVVAPIAPHDLSARAGLCTYCHESSELASGSPRPLATSDHDGDEAPTATSAPDGTEPSTTLPTPGTTTFPTVRATPPPSPVTTTDEAGAIPGTDATAGS